MTDTPLTSRPLEADETRHLDLGLRGPTPRLADVRAPRAAALALLLGPVVLAVAGAVHPDVPGDDAGQIAAAIGDAAGAWQAWAALLLVGTVVTVPGALRLLRVVGRGRGSGLTLAGAVLLVLGAVGAGGFAVVNSLMVSMLPPAGTPAPELLDGLARSETADPLAGATVLLFFVGVHVGWPLLLAGATRARWARPWQWVLATLGSVAVFGLSGQTLLVEALGLGAVAVAAAPTAVALRRAAP
ncbi:hypothetical protein [Cellulomonas marina]|uniref:DUF4386 family protein n=1 Tax=Cellulomonas marina TaxID=988821 RepID=A0A1I1AHT2_9CELL|nr:hypothetical protein [Cellulomonas marina]GIG30199.1 hypothetical protein Cma02nite_27990 [Cellulomonas marina]SFB37052.1 hypothetical protein SAMN05421867_11825 [Cellulomonas marina]